MSFPTPKANPAPNCLTIPKLNSALQSRAVENIPQPTDHRNPEVSDNVPSSALLCVGQGLFAVFSLLCAPWYSLPLERRVEHSVLLAVDAVPWQEIINEVEGASMHDWCRWKACLCLISLRNCPGTFHKWGNMACSAARASNHSGYQLKGPGMQTKAGGFQYVPHSGVQCQQFPDCFSSQPPVWSSIITSISTFGFTTPWTVTAPLL